MSSLDHWLVRHGLGGLELRNVTYRPGATMTCGFGVANGYRIVDGELQFGWARIHTGVDRAGARSGDIVVCPLPNDWTQIVNYRGEGYGALLRLVSQEWQYELRIAHMHPTQDIEPSVLDLLERGQPLPVSSRIGRAGEYGVGKGRHTHTELVAWGAGSDMFAELAERLYGMSVHDHETERDVLDTYRGLPNWRQATDQERLADYAAQRTLRGITWSNRYMHRYTDPLLGRACNRFSTWLVLGL